MRINLTIICSILLSTLITWHTAGSQPANEILFELEPAYISTDRQPTADWWMNIRPQHDNTASHPVAAPLRLPAIAGDHPLFRNVFRLSVSDDESAPEWVQMIQSQPGVVWCETAPIRKTCVLTPSQLNEIDAPPGDPYYHLQWWLPKISAPAAWDISRGDSSVVIAVVDVGVDVDHGDLMSKCWVNPAEAGGVANVDDDRNGFIDDIYGWDFCDDDPDPRPENNDGHGTHVAGIAAAAVDNSYGVAGIGWNCRIMSVRTGRGSTILYGYEGVVYAASAGADIINLSWGSDTPSNIERITTEYAQEQGALLVAAVGNKSTGQTFNHYPAGYEGVLSVAAVDTGDRVAAFSNTGDWVDIVAPGARILSTTPGGFSILSGTSMATPMVSGAAGLLKAIHMDWRPDQLRKQIILSSDPIDSLNPDLIGQFGGGRLNLYRVLNESQAGFEIVTVEIDDDTEGNGDGIIDPNEWIGISFEIVNLLTESASPIGWITSEDPYIQITPDTVDFGPVNPGSVSDNHGTPIRSRVSRSAPSGRVIPCKLNLDGNDLDPQSLAFSLTARPPYDEHDNGQVVLTITNFGTLGYFDYTRERGVGEGMRYPKNGLTSLFHGSLMVGVGPDRVSDCAYGDSAMSRYDFVSLEPGFIVQNMEDGSQESHARFVDDRATLPIDVEINQSNYSYSEHPDDDYVILSYNVINRGRQTLDSVYIALFLDWDVIRADGNICWWNGDDAIGWMEYETGDFPAFGAALLDCETSFHAAIDNQAALSNNDWTDRVKYRVMTSGFASAEGLDPRDYSQMIGTLQTDLDENGSAIVTFALAAGDDSEDLQENIQSARTRWNNRVNNPGGSVPIPDMLELVSAFPMPFNNRVNLVYHTRNSGTVSWALYDMLGKRVIPDQTLVVNAGLFTIPITKDMLPSGYYLIEIQKSSLSLTTPVVLIK